MSYGTEDKTVAIVWVCVVPFAATLAVFAYLILCTTRRKTVDAATTSLLLSRVLHCGAAIMAALYTLKHWQWTQTDCQIMHWMWISAWCSDILTSLFFLMFYAGRIVKKSPRSPCYVSFLFLFIWGLSITAGGVPVITPHHFTSHNIICALDLTTTTDPIPGAMIGIIVITFLLIIVLVISIIAEAQSKILIYWTSRKADERRETVRHQRSPVEVKDVGDDTEQYWIQENGVNARNEDATSNASTVSESTPWLRSEKAMKDIRNIMVTAGILSVLFEITPQMVFFALFFGIDYHYSYSHEVSISIGLVHTIFLVPILLRVGYRYNSTYSKICCRGRKKRSKPATVYWQEERSSVDVKTDEVINTTETVHEVHEPQLGKAPITRVTSITIDDSTLTESSTDVLRENGHVNLAYDSTEVEVVIENDADDQDRDNVLSPDPLHLNILRSHSACVDRRSVASDTQLSVNTAVIRRSPSSLSQMINPPVPEHAEDIHATVENLHEAGRPDGPGATPPVVIVIPSLTLAEIKAENRDRDYVETDGQEEGDGDVDDSDWDSDSELWSNLYDYDEEELAAALEEEQLTSPQYGTRMRKASIALIAAHQLKKGSLASCSSASLTSSQRKEFEKLKRKMAKKKKLSEDKKNKKEEPSLTMGLAGLAKGHVAAHLAIAGRTESVDVADEVIGLEKPKTQFPDTKIPIPPPLPPGNNIPIPQPLPGNQASKIPIPPPLPPSNQKSTTSKSTKIPTPPPLPVANGIPTPPPLPPTKTANIPTPPPIPGSTMHVHHPDTKVLIPVPPPLPNTTKSPVLPAIKNNTYEEGPDNTVKKSNTLSPFDPSQILAIKLTPRTQRKTLETEEKEDEEPVKVTDKTNGLPPKAPETSPPPIEKPQLVKKPSKPQKRNSSKRDKKPDGSPPERSKKAMSTFRRDSIVNRQKAVEANETKSKRPERRPSLIDSKRPTSLPPIVLPPDSETPNPFAEVVAIQTRNPYIPMRKIYRDSKTSTLSTSNPFLHEIEMGLENEVAAVDPATNPFLLELHSTNSFTEDSFSEQMVSLTTPPATSPPSFQTKNPFSHDAQDPQAEPTSTRHQRKPSQDSNISSGSGTLGRRARPPLRSTVMGTSMVEFLRSQSEDQAEPV